MSAAPLETSGLAVAGPDTSAENGSAGAEAAPLRPRASRERILAGIRAAAITEFSLNGLKGTSTQAIAARAGLTKPQLHYYIAGKDELYADLLTQVLQDWKVVFAFDEGAKGPGPVLSDYIRRKLDHALDNPEISRIFTREVLDGGRNLERYWPNAREWTRKKVDIINGWIARGQMRPLDARLLLMHIWAITQHYADFAIQVRVMQDLPADAPLDRQAIHQEAVRFILLGCGVQPD